MDADGNPSVYFGMLNGKFAETVTIHGIGNGVDYITAGDYEGEKGALSVEEDGAYLTDGEAHTIHTYDATKGLRGSFEIKEVPAYVYDGIDAVEQGSVGKTAFSVDMKDAIEGGYGFRINWKPLMSTGAQKTEIEFGYVSTSGFTSYSTQVVPSIALQKHTFALLAGDGYVKLIADGVSEYISFGLSNELWELGEKINFQKMYVQYTADDKYAETCPGKWLVKLNPLEANDGEWYISDAADAQMTGEKISGAVEYDYRMYPTIEQNQTIAVNSTAKDILVSGNEAIKLYSKIALNFQMTLNVSEIPAYTSETEDAFILISFSNVVGGVTHMETTAKAFFVRLSWQDADTLVAYCKMDMESKERVITLTEDTITIEFGWTDSSSIIKINDETLLTASITKGHFGSAKGVQGYFAMRAYNGSVDENAKWAFTLSAPKHIDASKKEEPTPKPPVTSSDDTSSGVTEEKGCGSVLGGAEISVLAIAIGLRTLFTQKRKENNQ